MSDNPLSQNEMFQLLGNFPSRPCAKLEPAGPALTGKEQLALLKENIRKGGILAASEFWGDFTDPFLGCALKMTASGLTREQISAILNRAAMADTGGEENGVELLRYIRLIMDALFCAPIRGNPSHG